MTTIAWRDGILAADTATFIHEGNTRVPEGAARKITRLRDGSLIAGSGVRREINVFAHWYDSGCDPDKKPEFDNVTVLHVSHGGCVTIHDGKYDEREIGSCPFYAMGSGAAAALGAMHAGATAAEAVAIAMLIDPWTGGEIQVERLAALAEAAD